MVHSDLPQHLLGLPTSLRVLQIELAETLPPSLTVSLISEAFCVPCPLCHLASSHVHTQSIPAPPSGSSLQRTVAHAPRPAPSLLQRESELPSADFHRTGS